MNTLNKIQKGILAYKKYKANNYKELEKYIDVEKFTFSIAKIESNFNSKAISKDGYNTFGLFQLLKSVLRSTVLSYTKNYKLAESLYYKNIDSQVFVFLQLTYLNLKALKSKDMKLCDDYQKVVNALYMDFNQDTKIKNEIMLAYLHNQGTSSLIRQARNFNVSVFYIPNFVSIRKWIKQVSITNISSTASISPTIYNRLLKVSINKLAVDFVKYSKFYTPTVTKLIPKITADTKVLFRAGLLSRLTFLGLLLTPTSTGKGADLVKSQTLPNVKDFTPSKPTETIKEKVLDKAKDDTLTQTKEVENPEKQKEDEEKKTGKTYLAKSSELGKILAYGALGFLFLMTLGKGKRK